MTKLQSEGRTSTKIARSKQLLPLAVAVAAAVAGAASGGETITYTYDARGRMVRVVRTGTVNNNVQTSYQYDKTNNRKNKVTTGSSNPPPP